MDLRVKKTEVSVTEINGTTWTGANNVKTSERFFVKKGQIEPKVILNADVTVEGRLVQRTGKTLFVTLSGVHSLWAGLTCMLCIAGGYLYRVIDRNAVQIGVVNKIKYPYSYVEAEGKVYISNPYWQGVFDPSNDTISSWGVTVPPGAMLLSGDGDLPAGTYYICMTNVSGTELSGNGSISKITLTTTGGIQVLNRPTGALVWCTDANEGIFYLVGAISKIINLPKVEPLPSFLCSPPPYLENLCYAFGRIWGSSGSDVYYSLPFKLGQFRLASNIYHFEDDVTLIAKVPTGLFIGMRNKTKFLSGTVPEKMEQSEAGAGSIKGTLAYCNNMPELGWTLGTPEKDFVDVPVWLTTEGVVVGSPTGKYFNVTKNKIKMPIPEGGASLYRNLEGIIQFLTSFKSGTTGSGAGFNDIDTNNVFKNGQIDIHEVDFKEMGSIAKFTDTVSCTVTRNGVLI
jgi:hypothetical protein